MTFRRNLAVDYSLHLSHVQVFTVGLGPWGMVVSKKQNEEVKLKQKQG